MNNQGYFVRNIPFYGKDMWTPMDSLDDAKAYADENARFGCVVVDNEGALVYAPLGRTVSEFLYEAKQVTDYVRDHSFTYGDAPINPAINHDAKLVSCDRLVDWALYRLGYVDQTASHGMAVGGCPGYVQLADWCAEHGFTKIDNQDDLKAGDIIFIRLNAGGFPGHTFILASDKYEDGNYYRYDCGKTERIRSTQPSYEPISEFAFAYRLPEAAMPGVYFKYDGVPFTVLGKKKETNENGFVYTLPDGLVLECRIERFVKYNVTKWVNYWSNPTDHNSGTISSLYDCDTTAYFEPDPPKVRRNRQMTWEPNTLQLFVVNATQVRDDDVYASPVRLWPGESYRLPGNAGKAPFFDVNRREKGMIFAIGWTGRWDSTFYRSSDGFRVRTGIINTEFYIKPGESFRTSSMTILEYNNGQTNAHNVWRRYIREVLSPFGKGERPARVPFSAIFWGGVTSENLKNRWKAIYDAKLPIDTCWIDAGWYEPLTAETCAEQSATWGNVGDWRVNKKYHPNEYQDVLDLFAEHGTDMMVWMEPERMRKTVKIWTKYLEHPDPNRVDMLVALNDDEACNDVINLVSGVIEKLNLSVYRQDFNSDPTGFWDYEKNNEPGRKGICEIKYILGLYKFWDALLERFPHLRIDDCAGGGHRIDIEMLGRSAPMWRSDYQCAWDCCPEANQVQNFGAAWWYPYSGIGYGPTLGDTYSFRSAYTSGITIRTWEHSDPEWEVGGMNEPLDWAKKYFDEYVSVQDYFTRDFYPLIANSRENVSWSASQFDYPEGGSGIILAFRRARSPFDSMLVNLGGICADKTYKFYNFDTEETFTVSGQSLLDDGLRLSIPNMRQSLLIKYECC